MSIPKHENRLTICKLSVDFAFFDVLSVVVGSGNSLLLCHPFLWSHACSGLESAEESALVGEARLQANGGNLHVSGLVQQLLGMLQAVVVDQLAKRATLGVDAGGDGVAVNAKGVRHVTNLHFGVKIKVLSLRCF